MWEHYKAAVRYKEEVVVCVGNGILEKGWLLVMWERYRAAAFY